jgi:phenylpropionate dioxygenase-like ring-hydroxylating dioxygenase large terminal subunit
MTEAWPIAIANGWHPVAYDDELRANKPLAVRLMGEAIVLFRDKEGVAALADSCPHRNVPLSGGTICDNALVCPYHGWVFNGEGACVAVAGVSSNPGKQAKKYQAKVYHRLIWVSLASDPPPFAELPPEIDDPNLDGFWWPLRPREARALDALENHLDPMHPHFLHPHLVRGKGKRMTVPVTVQSTPYGAEASYEEEHLPQTLLPRLIEGKRMRSIGRYFAPLTGQVAFENSKGLTIAISVVFSPMKHNLTRPYAYFATPKGRMPAWLKNRLITAFHRPVLAQDAAILKAQSRNIARQGGADFAIGPADILGPTIWRSAHGKEPETFEKRLELEL